jgi:L-aspartate-alpha-decarboxylase
MLLVYFVNFAPAMQIEVLKSKIHRVTITQADLDYIGSVTIDEDLMDAANLIENEKVDIFNYNNGERFSTYVIKGERGSKVICLNGPASLKVKNRQKYTSLLLFFLIPKQTHSDNFEETSDQHIKISFLFKHWDLSYMAGC